MSWPVFIDLEEHVVPFDLDRKTPHPCRRWRAMAHTKEFPQF